ncbi:MAG: hypothetical protein O7I42_00600 [Alphaproteobacteria bacterium]|nr:hypothetical protein [Alphaproteobacteria bacterium]
MADVLDEDTQDRMYEWVELAQPCLDLFVADHHANRFRERGRGGHARTVVDQRHFTEYPALMQPSDRHIASTTGFAYLNGATLDEIGCSTFIALAENDFACAKHLALKHLHRNCSRNS